MRKYLILLSLIFKLTAQSAQAQSLYFPPITGNAWDTISPSSLGWCNARIDSLYAYLQNTNTDAFIVLKDGKIVLEKYFGTFTQDSIHYWASAGKSLTSMMMGIAQQKKLLSIKDTVSKFLGAGWTSEPIQKENLITIKHLLTMTSGLNDAPALPCTNLNDTKECLQYLTDAGTRWAYHSGAYRKLEDIISTITGISYTAATNNFIGNKIGMKGIWFQSVYYSKAREMARYGLLALNKGVWQGDSILTDTAYFRSMINTSQQYNLSYGYLWWLNGKASTMIPTSQHVFPTKLIPNAPNDMFCALGKNDQKIYVVPSQNMVIIRMGGAAYEGDAVTAYDTLVWSYINKLNYDCVKTSVIENKSLKLQECTLYPNPANNFISFNNFPSQGETHYTVINTYGQITLDGVTNNHTINVSDLPQGQYILNIYTTENYATKQFVKL